MEGKKKIKVTIIWLAIILIAAGLGYSLYVTLMRDSPWISTCPETGPCFLTAHIHAYTPIEICRESFRLPIEVGRLDHPHTHEERNIIHWHDKLPYDRNTEKILDTKPLTMGAFFDSIETTFDKDKIAGKKNGELCPNGKAGSVKVFVNGKIINPADARNYIWKDRDVIHIFFDSRQAEEIQEELQKNPVKFPPLGRG